MTTKYTKGTLFEREIKQWLEHNEYYVIRSAGSHGLADLVAFPKKSEGYFITPDFPFPRYPLLIQIKSLGDDLFNTSTRIDSFLWSRELTEFRTEPILFAGKYLFIFNSKSRRDIPYVYEFVGGNYNRIYINGFI